MRFAPTLLLGSIILCPASAQPVPADDEAIQNLIRNHLAKIAAPTIYSSLFEIPQAYTPGKECEVFVLRSENEVTACIDELQSGWVWLVRPGPRLDLIDNERWDPSSRTESCASFLDGERRIHRPLTYDEQDKRIREKQGLPPADRETEFIREPKTFRSLNFRWQVPQRANPGAAAGNQLPSTLPEVKQEIQRVAAQRRADCGPGEALLPRFEDDDPALIVYIQAGRNCKDFVIDLIPDLEGRLTLGSINGDWDLQSVRALVESMLLERAPLLDTQAF
jgi:hypothetical protein